ncbi:hypothetical protein IR083_21090 [Dysgonomonas sp. GY75]|uniref:DUF6291 domain-containing protein n=1 Tax=Dysgonomonas sp. GY75 TaxID=2780419 RepID=UPI0018841930|nr:DUF6291 domain-containing protein [Dysgonomonas sp. GY75]MBF0651317.1 hypothetical protein [Dysgonomonas sp. GY75]
MAKKSFVFYKGWKDAIVDLPDDVRLEIYDSIIEYAVTGIMPMLKPMANIAFNFIKNDIDRDAQAYADKCAKNKENSFKGGAPKGNKNAKKTTETTERLKKQPKQPDDDNDNDINNSSSTDVLLCETSQPHVDDINYTELVNWFNKTTNGVFGILRIPLSEKRKGMIRSRIREHGKDLFCEAIKIAYKSDFLKGSGRRDFKASFDWIIKPTNFEKIISGNYDNKNIGNNKNTGITDDLARNIAEGIARANYEK